VLGAARVGFGSDEMCNEFINPPIYPTDYSQAELGCKPMREFSFAEIVIRGHYI
jgi:hypothetical protein